MKYEVGSWIEIYDDNSKLIFCHVCKLAGFYAVNQFTGFLVIKTNQQFGFLFEYHYEFNFL